MRHRKRGRKLSRTSKHRKALRKNLAMALFEHGHITTTVPKAKEVQSFVEKIITLSKTKTLHNYRRVLSILQTGKPTVPRNSKGRPRHGVHVEPRHKAVARKLFDEIGPMMADRPGGYTRILRLAKRRVGDATPLALFALVTENPIPSGESDVEATEAVETDAVVQGAALDETAPTAGEAEQETTEDKSE